jgi:hypothetical protein
MRAVQIDRVKRESLDGCLTLRDTGAQAKYGRSYTYVRREWLCRVPAVKGVHVAAGFRHRRFRRGMS